MLEYDGFREGDVVPRAEDIGVVHLKGDGDFRSEECIDILKQADIVVTNPPFSLFREYVAQLVKNNKKFLIIGPKNAVTYKDVFRLIKGNKIWIGMRPMSGSIFFKSTRETVDFVLAKQPRPGGYWRKENDGGIAIAQPCAWYTNLDHKKRHEELILYKKYGPEQYSHYDNYDAIEVDKTKEIPMDWGGIMGVPITFLDKHNPDQFEIVGITKTWFGAATKIYPKQVQVSISGKRSEVTKLNDGAALLIDGPIDQTYYIVDGRCYRQAYARILIRNKNPEVL